MIRMLYRFLPFLLASAALAQTPAERLAKWKHVDMPFHSAGLSPRENQMVDKLVEACRLLDDVYWRQSDLAGLHFSKTTPDPTSSACSCIMGSRWDLLDENRPFVGDEPMPPGPRALSRTT